MKDIVFLTKDHILQLHEKAIKDYGGEIMIRDLNLLESSIAQPQVSFGGEYLHQTIYLMGAAYFYHISQNQPFMDGNKRTGFLAMFTFLKENGYELTVPDSNMYPILCAVAEGKMGKTEFANFIERNSKKV